MTLYAEYLKMHWQNLILQLQFYLRIIRTGFYDNKGVAGVGMMILCHFCANYGRQRLLTTINDCYALFNTTNW